jgi:hypothetical protein
MKLVRPGDAFDTLSEYVSFDDADTCPTVRTAKGDGVRPGCGTREQKGGLGIISRL